MLHTVDGIIQVEMQLGDDTQLMSLQCPEFSAELARVLLYRLHSVRHLVLREDGEVHMCYRQVGRHTHLAHRDKRSLQGTGKAQEDIAKVFLYEPCDLVLSSSLHNAGDITKKPTHGSSSARNASQQPEAV